MTVHDRASAFNLLRRIELLSPKSHEIWGSGLSVCLKMVVVGTMWGLGQKFDAVEGLVVLFLQSFRNVQVDLLRHAAVSMTQT